MEYPVRLEELHAISLGNDVKIARGTWINPVGEWSGTKYGGEIVIGDRTWISYDVQISAARSVVIEEDVVIASGAVIVDHLHDHSYIDKPIFMSPLTQPDPVRIGKGSFLGVNCFIGPGVQIGEHAVIGANAVVTKNVPSYCIAVGFRPACIDSTSQSRSHKLRTMTTLRIGPARCGLAEAPIAVAAQLLPSIASGKSSSARRLFSNSAAMAIANLAGRGLGYAYIVLMARKLDARYLGAYAVLVTTSLLIELVSNLGLDKILVREITKGSAEVGQGFFLAALPVRLAMALPAAACAWLLLHAFFFQRLFAPFWCIALYLCAVFPVVAARNCEAFLTAHERLLPVAISQACERAIVFLAVVALAFGQINFAGLLCIIPVASLLRLVIVASATRRLWNRTVRAIRPPVFSFLQQAVELLSVEILAMVYFRSDTFLVARMNGLAVAGIYQITYKIFDLCISLFAGFLQAVFPRMVRDRSRASLLKILGLGVAALLVPATIIILARGLILGSIHPEYIAGSTSLIWLMLTVPLVFTTSTLANAAIVAGHVRVLIVCAALLIVTNVGMNLILIPKYSINGAAFSTFACELLSAALLGPFIFFKLARSQGAA